MNARILSVLSVIMLLCGAGAARAQAIDASLARAFRELRAAEMRDDVAAVAAAEAISPGTDASERAAIARAAIELRAKARTAADVRAAEDTLAERRAALARAIGARAPDAARELMLEAAEDLLLRRIAADGSDAMIAIGLPTKSECAATRDTLARVDAMLRADLLREALGATAALATDPLAFRANFLAGIAASMQSDLDACEGRDPAAARAAAAALLANAARSELPAPAEIAAILSLARARASNDAAARATLLADAARSADPTRAFVARVEQWRDRSARADFPEAPAGLDMLAIAAELKQRDPAEIPSAVERAFRSAAAKGGPARAQRLAAALAARIDDRARAAASTPDASPALLALVAVAGEDRAFMRSRLDALMAAAQDPAITPWLAVPLARELQAANRPLDATRMLVAFVEQIASAAGAGDDAREALDIALELAHAAARADASGEVSLDRVLEVAAARFRDDPRRTAWLLERVDLAIFPTWTLANADRAAQLLLSVPTDGANRPARDLRAAEIDALRAGKDADAALSVVRKAELLGTLLPRSETELVARAETLRAEMLLAASRDAEALACASLALRERGTSDRTALRAAAAWLRAAMADDDPIAPPAELVARAAQIPAIAEQATHEVDALAASTEESLLRGDAQAARKSAAERLAPLVRIAEASPAAPNAVVARASVLAELAAGNAAEAFARADRATKRWPSDRALLWLRAESCRAQGADEATRARAFAFFRELSPLAAKSRDEYWWRAQLAQLEMLADDAAQREQVLARVNRLAALDKAMGSPLLARRFEQLRARCATPGDGARR